MSVRRFDLEAGAETFEFSGAVQPKIDFWLGKYPEDRKRSAVIPLLWIAQKDNEGWLSEPAMRRVADLLEMPYIRVYEVATFYTMFNLKPVGKHHVQLCGTTPCMLRGANDLKAVCERKIGKKEAVTDDGRLSWVEVECLGSCVNAPMVQINDYYYEDLTPESFEHILDQLSNGVDVPPGNFVKRDTSAPEGAPTSLTATALYDGSPESAFSGIPNMPDVEARTGTAMLKSANGAAGPAKTPAAPAPKETKAVSTGTSTKATTGLFGAIQSFNVGGEGASSDADKPAALSAPRGGAGDDLKQISGVGAVIEQKLHGLGIFHFDQIAAWTAKEIDWVDGYLSFKGRIQREDWIAQAKKLAEDS